eukprot:jgi/Ulvmu1/9400/UM051_0028.1
MGSRLASSSEFAVWLHFGAMSRKVELVRLGADEAEALPGPPPRFRSAADVFNKDGKRMKRPDEETIKKALEGKKTKFVSEAELTQNKELYGERLEDGTFSGKTLTEAIIAQREEKDAKFKDNWKQMKQGKNRPLEDDELHFLQQLADEESAKEKAIRELEQKALERLQATHRAAVKPVPHSLTPGSQIRHKPASKRHKVVPRAAKPAEQIASGPDAAVPDVAGAAPPGAAAQAPANTHGDAGNMPESSFPKDRRESNGAQDMPEGKPEPGEAGHDREAGGAAPGSAARPDDRGRVGGTHRLGTGAAVAGGAAGGLLSGYSSSSESDSDD